jgi:hypothetical protein
MTQLNGYPARRAAPEARIRRIGPGRQEAPPRSRLDSSADGIEAALSAKATANGCSAKPRNRDRPSPFIEADTLNPQQHIARR